MNFQRNFVSRNKFFPLFFVLLKRIFFSFKAVAQKVTFGRFFNGGQTCIACDYVLVEEKIADDLVSIKKNY